MKNKSFIIFILIIIYKRILDYAYINIVVKYWGYIFFPVKNIGIIEAFASWVCALLPFFILDFKKKTLSNYVIGFLYFINYIPGCVFMAYISDHIQYSCVFLLYWMCFFIINRLSPYFLKKIIVGRNGYIINGILVVFFVCVIVVIWLTYANARMYLKLDDIYVARAESYKFQMPIILDYCFSFASAIIPVSILVCLLEKKWKASILLTIIGYMVYLIAGSKVALFLDILVWGIWSVRNIIKEEKIWLYVVIGLDTIGIIGIVTRTKILRISAYFFERLMFEPAIINVHFYHYFKDSEKDYFRQSIVGKITGISSPYKVDIPHLIGKYGFNNSETCANSGVVGDAYANLGVMGIVIMPILIIFMLRILDICIKGLDYKIYLFLGIIIGIYIMSNSFFTTLLSNGILIISFYLISVRRERDKVVT